jgi:hypothetical protein
MPKTAAGGREASLFDDRRESLIIFDPVHRHSPAFSRSVEEHITFATHSRVAIGPLIRANRAKTQLRISCNANQEVAMSATDVHDTSRDASVGRVDMKLEVQIIPVSDVDRSKELMVQFVQPVRPRPS